MTTDERQRTGRPRDADQREPSLPRSRQSAGVAEALQRDRPTTFWAPFLVLALVLPMGLAQAWFAHEPHEIAYDLGQIEEEARRVRDDLEAALVECESLKAPHSVAAVAVELGFERPAVPPVVIQGSNRPNAEPHSKRFGGMHVSMGSIVRDAAAKFLTTDDEQEPRQLSASAQGLGR